MTKEMIISSNGHETRVAILEEDQVTEIFIERERQRGVVGNVYKGRVSKVLPGMQSAFIDIGLERDGFLYVSDVIDTIEEFDRLEAGDEDEEREKNGNSVESTAVNGAAGRERNGGSDRPPGAPGGSDRAAGAPGSSDRGQGPPDQATTRADAGASALRSRRLKTS